MGTIKYQTLRQMGWLWLSNSEISLSEYKCRNITASKAYGVYISQLIRYARACVQYGDFLEREGNFCNKRYSVKDMSNQG